MSCSTQTPPHHPTYNVHLSQDQLASIAAEVFPEYQLDKIQQLEHGKSFNNRIYFLHLVPFPDHGRNGLQLVLKVCGQYFGAHKLQNEVGALLMLNQHCPSVPTPRVLAWSDNGKTIECVRDGQVEVLSAQAASWQSSHGWILISRLPGRILQTSDLDGAHGPSLLRQSAHHVFTWRTTLPRVKCIGNIRLDAHAPTPLPINLEGRRFAIGGLILNNKYDAAAYPSWGEYYRSLLHDKYDHLITAPELRSLAKRIADPVSTFLPMMPRLPFLTHNNNVRFTHMDLSPRNILVSETLPHSDGSLEITGIVDWEFAAFLPSPMEWLNSLINQPDDWPEHHYQGFLSYLSELERQQAVLTDLPMFNPPKLGCTQTDRCVCPHHTFKHLATLERAISHVAPWWITPTAYSGRQTELEEVCNIAEKIVLESMNQLKGSLG